MNRRSIFTIFACTILMAVMFIGLATPAQATHFRYGNISWSRGMGNTVTFTVTSAWRSSGGLPVLNGQQNTRLFFGDGAQSPVPVIPGNTTIIGNFTDLAGETYVIVRFVTSHTYANEGPFTAFFRGCCRISTLQNNANDKNYRVETIVDMRGGNTGSVVTSTPVILQMVQGTLNTFTIPIADPDGDATMCRMSTTTESGIPNVANATNTLTVSSACLLSWQTDGTTVGDKYAVQVTVEETHAGNVGKVAVDFIIEIVTGSPPVCSSPVSGNNIVSVGQAFSATFTGTDSDGGDLTVSDLGSLPPGATLTPASGTTQAEPFAVQFDWTPLASDAGSAHAITIAFTDPTGLQSICTFSITVPLNQAPVVFCLAGNVVVDADANCEAMASIDNGSFDPDGDPITIVQTPPGPYQLGSTLVTLTVTDDQGLSDQCQATVTVVDNTPPTIACPADMSVSTDPGACDAVVNYPPAIAADNCPGVTVLCSPPSGSVFALGSTTVTCAATDGAGAVTTCSFTVTVSDTEDPGIICGPDLVVVNDPGSCDAVVSYAAATATDNCPGVSVSCAPPSGSTFPVGTTPVVCTATDAAGNAVSCTFLVTVEDSENPTVSCSADMVVASDPGICGAVVNYAPAAAADNCPGVTVDCVPASGSTFPVGVTTVCCTATDAAGNVETCCFDVTVEDVEDPVVTCPADLVVGTDPGACDAVVSFSATVADNCPGASVTCNPPSGSTFPIGTTNVICIGTDASGNANTCQFTVTVEDTEAPALNCPADIFVENDPGECGAVVDFVATASDNCPGVTFSCDAVSGSVFPVGTTTICCTATDAAGNVETCCFDITVEDTESPTVVCPSTGGSVARFADLPPCDGSQVTTDDNCGIASVDCVYGVSGVGCTGEPVEVIYQFVATDLSGNADTCLWTVTVAQPDCPIPTYLVSGFNPAGAGCTCDCHGDPACDGVINVLDVVRVVSVAFRGASATTDAGCGVSRVDTNCDGVANVLDVVGFVNVAFRGGDASALFCAPCAR